jgi:hypothetical protein
MGDGTSINTFRVISKGTFIAATPYKEGGIGIKFNNKASTSYLKE